MGLLGRGPPIPIPGVEVATSMEWGCFGPVRGRTTVANMGWTQHRYNIVIEL
jgi:hypothetical protein